MNVDQIAQQAKAQGVRMVRFLFCDNGGVIRGKASSVDGLAGRLRAGIGLTPALQLMSLYDNVCRREDLGLFREGDLRMIPDPSTYRPLPYAPESASVFCDLHTLGGGPWAACPRSFLKRQIDRAADKGIRFCATFENEWTAVRRTGETYVAAGEHGYGSSIAMHDQEPILLEIMAALEAQGMRPGVCHPEHSPGQQELVIAPADALLCADNQLLFRETVRAIYRRHGLLASFAPMPFAGAATNGAHLHISLWDAERGRSLTYDPTDPCGASRLAYQFIGGVLRHLPALTAIACPTPNSYSRLKASPWAKAGNWYGYDSRRAPVRVASAYLGRESESANVEVRIPDPSCNPYLTLGAIIAAGMDGIAHETDPGAPLAVDATALPPEELERMGIRPLPTAMPAALYALAADDVIRGALGELLYETFVTVKRGEEAVSREHDFATEQKHHIYRF
ncbi:MAG TPA: glutamine synthetase family protein [Symbiobacteriaceae bacterium]|nr:glutamine synthetase family protein [Symbiobacteriaceae bacterium]